MNDIRIAALYGYIKPESETRMFHPIQWMLLGALGTLFLFFFIFYLTKRDENYNLFFALGCLVTVVRIIAYSHMAAPDQTSVFFRVNVAVNHLSFIWGPFLYIITADSLFPVIQNRIGIRIMFGIAVLISVFILFVPMELIYYGAAYDYIIAAFILYAEAIYVLALKHRLPFSVPVFIGNLVFISGVIHDVLLGSHIISGSQGELFMYAYLVYAAIMAAVLAHRYMQSDKKRLEAQLKFLHAQIQPHFLYNTLGTISAYCQSSPKTANELLEYLSTYLRGKFRGESDQFVCLNDEIELVKAYLTIEQARFKERIAVDYDIEDGCNVLIPSLILQPLVENAVKHGLLPRREGGKIRIRVHRQGGAVKITVGDDGFGMDKKTRADVLEGRGKGIGIGNTKERLKRYYGTQLDIRSAPGEGCEVSMLIPQTGGETK